MSESYIQLPDISHVTQFNRRPSSQSGGSLELFDKGSSLFNPPYLANPPYIEESGSDGLSVNSDDVISRGSDTSSRIHKLNELTVQPSQQTNTQDSCSQSDTDHVLQAYKSPPSYANRVGEQRDQSRTTMDTYHHPPPYREVRVKRMAFQRANPLYSRSDGALNTSMNGQHSVGSHPECGLNGKYGYQNYTRQQQFAQKAMVNMPRNNGIFRKVDKETMTDECAEESDSSLDGFSLYHQEIMGNMRPPNPEVMSYYSGNYEPYSGLSFSDYVEPQKTNLGSVYNSNHMNSQGTSTSSITGNGGYSQVAGEIQLFASPDGSQWSIVNSSSTSRSGVGKSVPGTKSHSTGLFGIVFIIVGPISVLPPTCLLPTLPDSTDKLYENI